MPNTLASSAAPVHHLKVWSDGQRIFVEIPGVSGKPSYITTYPYDSRGVDLTLSLIGCQKAAYDYQGEAVPAGFSGRSSKVTSASSGTNAQAELILRKMGVVR